MGVGEAALSGHLNSMSGQRFRKKQMNRTGWRIAYIFKMF